jgi:hypothetical protein
MITMEPLTIHAGTISQIIMDPLTINSIPQIVFDPVVITGHAFSLASVLLSSLLISIAVACVGAITLAIIDIVKDFTTPETKIQYLAFETIECDHLQYRQYEAWAMEPETQEKLNLILKEWLVVQV